MYLSIQLCILMKKMVSNNLFPKMFFAVLTVALLLVTVHVALAEPEVQVRASFDSPTSSLARIQVQTAEVAICKYDLLFKDYSKMTQTFEQTGDLEHEQRVVIRDTTTLYIGCANLQGQVYEATSLQLHAPQHIQNLITGHSVESTSSSNGFFYIFGLICITTLLVYAVGKKRGRVEKAYHTLPPYQAARSQPGLPTLSAHMVQNLLRQAHHEIDTQHFQESLTKYKYVLHLLDTHQLEKTTSMDSERVHQQAQQLYYKLNLYNQLLWAHKYWTRNSRQPLRQTMTQIQKTYNTLRHTPSSSLLNNAYKSYAFYEQYLKRAK